MPLDTGWSVWDKVLSGREKKTNVVIEIGIFLGDSTLWFLDNMMSNKDSRLYSIDTFQGSPEYGIDFDRVKDKFFQRVENHPKKSQLHVIEKDSYNGLLELNKSLIDKCDIIYIDGSHVAADVITDITLAWRLIKIGGIIIFDDYVWDRIKQDYGRPKLAIDAFLSIYSPHIDILSKKRQVVVRKKQAPHNIYNTSEVDKVSSILDLRYNLLLKDPLKLIIHDEKFTSGAVKVKYGQPVDTIFDVSKYVASARKINMATGAMRSVYAPDEARSRLVQYVNKLIKDKELAKTVATSKHIESYQFYSALLKYAAVGSHKKIFYCYPSHESAAELSFIVKLASAKLRRVAQVETFASLNLLKQGTKRPSCLLDIGFLDSLKLSKYDIAYIGSFVQYDIDSKDICDNMRANLYVLLHQIYLGIKLVNPGGTVVIQTYPLVDQAHAQILQILSSMFASVILEPLINDISDSHLLVLHTRTNNTTGAESIRKIITLLDPKQRAISSILDATNSILFNKVKLFYKRYMDLQTYHINTTKTLCEKARSPAVKALITANFVKESISMIL